MENVSPYLFPRVPSRTFTKTLKLTPLKTTKNSLGSVLNILHQESQKPNPYAEFGTSNILYHWTWHWLNVVFQKFKYTLNQGLTYTCPQYTYMIHCVSLPWTCVCVCAHVCSLFSVGGQPTCWWQIGLINLPLNWLWEVWGWHFKKAWRTGCGVIDLAKPRR